MSIERSELHDAAQKAFPADQLKPSRDASWTLIAEMGWLLLPLPEDAGGLGLGRDASAAIHFELGKVLSTAPLIPALLSLQALNAAEGLADRAGWIERATSGEFITTNLLSTQVSLGQGKRLNARLTGVPDADMASHVLICESDISALVPVDAPGVSIVERPLWDESRRLFDVTVADHALPPEMILAEGAPSHDIAHLLHADLPLALAADSLGGAAAALDMTVEYLKTRKQFDRPLAMFQALKHRCADMKIRLSSAEALMWTRATDPDAGIVDFGALKALASDVYRMIAEEAIQLHGGIGLTEEHNCHLFMKRAMLNLQLGGSLDTWREITGKHALAQYAA